MTHMQIVKSRTTLKVTRVAELHMWKEKIVAICSIF